MAPPTTSSDGIVAMSLSDEDDQEGTSPATELPLDQSEHSTFDTLGLRAERIARRSTIAPRTLDKGGIAGVVVGVCVAVSLVCLCFWPFIIRRIKAKRQHQANLATSDAEANHAPVTDTAAGQEPHAHRPATQHSSRDSLSHKEDPFGGPGRQSSKELDLNADNGPEHLSRDGASTLHQRGPSDHLVVERNQVVDRRHSGTSFGQNPTWNAQGQMPITPGGIELITTRADGMEYSDVINGQSASYYSPTEPTENFGMVTPPQADEAQFPAPARSNSRTSSFKYNLMSMATKKALSIGTNASFSVESLIDGFDFASTVNRLRYEMSARKVFEGINRLIEGVIKKAGLDVLDIDEVVLSGGTSHTPR
ncbi:hypothetical protein BN1723_017270, partial [Verticillium longisporum]